MKVHISFVGGQPAPVYHGIVATQPDYVVLVYSKDTAHYLDRLKEVLMVPVETVMLHPTNPSEILKAAQSLAERFSQDHITVNISSGLKSWSHLFGITFQPLPNAHVVYMDQNNVLWDYRTMSSRDDYQFDMDILFRLHGNPLNHFKRFAEYTAMDERALRQIETMRRYNYSLFNQLTALLSKEMESKLSQHSQGLFIASDGLSYIEWDKQDPHVKIVLNHKGWGVKDMAISSPHVIDLTFHSGWFEYKVARMLSHWSYSKEIRLNCIFPLRDNRVSTSANTKNEIDVIVNTGRKMLFVECKTNITSSLDIDKFRTAVKNYGGLGSKALFVTDNKMSDLQKVKCQESHIIPISLAELGLYEKSVDPKKIEQQMFRILEKELLSINA